LNANAAAVVNCHGNSPAIERVAASVILRVRRREAWRGQSVYRSVCVCVCRKLKRSFDVPRDEFRDADGETGTGGDDERRDGVAVHHDSGAGRGVKEPTSVVGYVTEATYASAANTDLRLGNASVLLSTTTLFLCEMYPLTNFRNMRLATTHSTSSASTSAPHHSRAI